MLEIKKGKSSKSYENEFFRQFSCKLSHLFNENNWDGLLLGMPECITREELQIDSLLVTDNTIIIIDFKNYKGEVTLPSEHTFEYGRWLVENNIVVKGGSSPNPFKQIGKQRIKLIDELKYRLSGFDRKSIYTLICFQNEMQVIGEIPGKYNVGFAITDSQGYINKIFDILDILDDGRNYLSQVSKNVFTRTVFSTENYIVNNDTLRVNKPTTLIEVPRKSNKDILKQVSDFLNSESKVLTIYGTVKSGKTSLIPQIRELGFDTGIAEIPVFAYSSRLRSSMLKRNPELEDVESLYSKVFDFRNEQIDENYKKTIPLKTIEEENAFNKKLYIVEDSQLITNSYIDSEYLKFGTGYLLDDVLSYFDLEKYPDSKFIFIGDKNKLSYGSKTENALNSNYLKALLENKKIYSDITEIELPNIESDSEIVKVCQNIANNLKNNKFNELTIADKMDISVLDKSKQIATLQESYNNPSISRIIVYTNEQANQVNQWIKINLAKNGTEVAVGDFVVFNSAIYSYSPSKIEFDGSPFDFADQPFDFVEPKRINNGMFGKIISVDGGNNLVKNIELGDGKEIQLKFISSQVQLQDETIVELLIFENYLNAERGELDTNEIVAYQIILSSLEKEAMEKEPFENSVEYTEMINNGDYGKRYDDVGKAIYRDKEDQRKMTKYEKDYRNRIISKLNSKDSEYFKILNSAKIKYAWCMTVNKAMAYVFDRVYFNTEQGGNRGKTNADYYKWLYTGISVGQSHVSLLKWQPISPFLHTEFNTLSPTNIPKTKNIIMTFSNGIEQTNDEIRKYLSNHLTDIGDAVVNIVSRPYLEIVTIKTGNEEIEMFFDYNKRGEVKLPRLKSGSEKAFQNILKAINTEIEDIPDVIGEMKDTFSGLSELLNQKNIKTKIILSHNWETIFRFSKLDEQVEVQVWHSGQGMISKFNFLQGNSKLFGQIVDTVKTTYGMD